MKNFFSEAVSLTCKLPKLVFHYWMFINNHELKNKIKPQCYFEIMRVLGYAIFFRRRIRKVKWLNEISFNFRHADPGISNNKLCGLEEFRPQGFTLHYLRPIDTFCDIGANSGAYSLLAMATDSTVFAFEPNRESNDRANSNFRLNKSLAQPTLIQAAVSDACGTLRITTDQGCKNRIITENIAVSDALDSEHINTVTLDSFFKNTTCTLTKIDTEGHELSILRGAEEYLANNQCRALIVEFQPECPNHNEELLSLIVSTGFKPITYNPQTREISEISGIDLESASTIFVKDIDEAKRRTRESKPFKIHTPCPFQL